MKTFLLTFISFFMLQSCSNNDDENTLQTNEVVTTWNLVKFEPGFSPTNNYTNEIQWSFTTNNINVVIQNGTSVNNSLPLSTNGTYPYSINGNQITIQY